MNEIAETKNLTKTYNPGQRNELKVLKGVDMIVKRGEFVSIYGPSGSGKSTLLHLIGCLDTPTSGKVYIEGKDTSRMSDDEKTRIRREKIGFVFQQFNLIPILTALENIEVAMKVNGNHQNSKQKSKKLLEQVGLGDRLSHRTNQLSGGEMQRVALARALANNPRLILADEPTGNLDTKTGKEIIKLMKDLNAEGHTFLVVTHDESIAKFADKKIHIVDGRIVGGKK